MLSIGESDVFAEFAPRSKEQLSKSKSIDLFSKISTSNNDNKETKIPSSLSLPQLLTCIIEEVSGKKDIKDVNIEKLQTIMKNYDASLGEWKRFAMWNKEKLYTRNLIATDNEKFTLMLLCWNAASWSPIHDHAGTECVFRVIQGEIQEKLYEYPEEDAEELKYLETISVKAGETTWINDDTAIHAVGNPTSDLGVTLHCYIPPYDKCRCFLDETSAKSIIGSVTFDSEHGELTNPCTEEDNITTCIDETD